MMLSRSIGLAQAGRSLVRGAAASGRGPTCGPTQPSPRSWLHTAESTGKPKRIPRFFTSGPRAWYKHHHSRLRGLFKEYGPVAIATYSTLYVTVFGGFYAGASWGIDFKALVQKAGLGKYADKLDSTTGNVLVAYAATTLTGPLRMFATAAVTPALAKRWPHWTKILKR